MIFIGIDPSIAGTGVCVLDEKLNILEQVLIKTKPIDNIESRYYTILMGIKCIIEKYKDIKITIEGLSFGSRGQSMLELAGLHYLIRFTFFSSGVSYSVVPPTALKKFITGKGNVKKEQMLLQVFKKFGVEFDDNNLCDAYCLARYAGDNNAKM